MSKKLEHLGSACVTALCSSVSLLSLEKVLLSCTWWVVSAFDRNNSEFAVKHIGKLEKFVGECVHVCACVCVSVSDWVEVASEKDKSLK